MALLSRCLFVGIATAARTERSWLLSCPRSGTEARRSHKTSKHKQMASVRAVGIVVSCGHHMESCSALRLLKGGQRPKRVGCQPDTSSGPATCPSLVCFPISRSVVEGAKRVRRPTSWRTPYESVPFQVRSCLPDGRRCHRVIDNNTENRLPLPTRSEGGSRSCIVWEGTPPTPALCETR
jgi:hypothetical protein